MPCNPEFPRSSLVFSELIANPLGWDHFSVSGQHLEPCQLRILAADGNGTLWWDRQHSSPSRSGSCNFPAQGLEKETSKQRGLRQDFPAADRERETPVKHKELMLATELQGDNESFQTFGGAASAGGKVGHSLMRGVVVLITSGNGLSS